MARDLSTYLFEGRPEICPYDIIMTPHHAGALRGARRLDHVLLAVFIFPPSRRKEEEEGGRRFAPLVSFLSSLIKFATRPFRDLGKYFDTRAIRHGCLRFNGNSCALILLRFPRFAMISRSTGDALTRVVPVK